MSRFDVYFCFNLINVQAACAVRRREPIRRRAIVLLEPTRITDRAVRQQLMATGQSWIWPANRGTLLLLVALSLLGTVRSIVLPHARESGHLLRFLLRRCSTVELLDDGLDQYRSVPRTLSASGWPAGARRIHLFSDLQKLRAPWCAQLTCIELGPFPVSAPPAGSLLPPAAHGGAATLIIDSPGVELLMQRCDSLPGPHLVLSHPARSKRSWLLPGEVEPPPGVSAEWLAEHFPGLVVVGETFTLVSCLTRRPPAWPLIAVLPQRVDPHLLDLVRVLARDRPGTEVVHG